MAESLDALLAEANDFDLCDGVFLLIVDHYGDDIDASSLPEEQRVVDLTWHTSGIIGNGGFRYLFEGDLKGDPYFALSAMAFRIIGCDQAADAFRKTLALFPQSQPQRDIKGRLKYYLTRCKCWPTEEDDLFDAGAKELPMRLAAYIRAHANAYRGLGEHPAPRPAAKAEPQRQPAKAGAKKPTLPHWARVAFAARCARRVAPLLKRHWPDVPTRYVNDIGRAIEMAEQSAGEGRPAEGLKEAVIDATCVAGAALSAGSDFNKKDPAPANAHEGTIASFAAKAAEKAAESARGSPQESVATVLEAWDFAKNAAESGDHAELIEAMEQDAAKLRKAAQRGNWTDRTVIPAEIWNML